MDKLLSDKELREKVEDTITRVWIDEASPQSAIDKIMHLIKTQKQAHADRVIGENEEWVNYPTLQIYDNRYYKRALARNALRDAQRKRNK